VGDTVTWYDSAAAVNAAYMRSVAEACGDSLEGATWGGVDADGNDVKELAVWKNMAVVMFSGGAQSFVAAQRAVAKFGASKVRLLFADTSAEDPDLYRFVIQAAASIGAPLHVVRDGRTPQQVLRDRKFLGSGRGAPCSEFLKRKPMDAWVAANAPDAVQVYGLSWEEMHRVEAIQRAKAPASVWCPLAEAPYLTRDDVLAAVEASGVAMPRLYRDGFAHNNCGGACVRAGQGAWLHLLNMKPDLYAEWEKWEQDMRASVGPYAILRDRTGGDVRPLPLVELRSRRRSDVDLFDIAGCGCATEYDDSAQPGNGGGEVGQ
jgi:3'-phosphoadenosine 5'-phosphosulfate sulfotransferase (PAPS reductase)/FAD synthetase